MLTDTLVVDYIKRNLGFPLMNIEISDEDILFYVKQYTLRLFSRHRPFIQYLVISREDTPELFDDNKKVIILPDTDHEIMNILDVIQTMKYLIFDYPYNPIPTWSSLPKYLENVMKSMAAYRYSQYNITFEFIRPKELRIYPYAVQSDSLLIIKGAFVNTIDTIPEDWSRQFLDLALADIMSYIANMRLKYQNYQTPYGEIAVNADQLRSQADDIRNRVMEELNGSFPDSFIMIG